MMEQELTREQKYARAEALRREAHEHRLQAKGLDLEALILESEADRERLGPYVEV